MPLHRLHDFSVLIKFKGSQSWSMLTCFLYYLLHIYFSTYYYFWSVPTLFRVQCLSLFWFKALNQVRWFTDLPKCQPLCNNVRYKNKYTKHSSKYTTALGILIFVTDVRMRMYLFHYFFSLTHFRVKGRNPGNILLHFWKI